MPGMQNRFPRDEMRLIFPVMLLDWYVISWGVSVRRDR